MTRDQAIASTYRQIFEHVSEKNADGTPLRVRVNGKCRTFKTRDDFILPVKYGLRHCGYITQDNAQFWRA